MGKRKMTPTDILDRVLFAGKRDRIFNMIIKDFRGDLTPEEQSNLQKWFSKHPEHQIPDAWQKVQALKSGSKMI